MSFTQKYWIIALHFQWKTGEKWLCRTDEEECRLPGALRYTNTNIDSKYRYTNANTDSKYRYIK